MRLSFSQDAKKKEKAMKLSTRVLGFLGKHNPRPPVTPVEEETVFRPIAGVPLTEEELEEQEISIAPIVAQPQPPQPPVINPKIAGFFAPTPLDSIYVVNQVDEDGLSAFHQARFKLIEEKLATDVVPYDEAARYPGRWSDICIQRLAVNVCSGRHYLTFERERNNIFDHTFSGSSKYCIQFGKYYGHCMLRMLCHQNAHNPKGYFLSIERFISDAKFKSDVEILTFEHFKQRWIFQHNGPFIICQDTFKDFNFNVMLPPPQTDNTHCIVQYDMMCFKQTMIFDLMRCCRILHKNITSYTCMIVGTRGEIEITEVPRTFFTNLSIQVYHELWHADCFEDAQKRQSKPFLVSITEGDGMGDFMRYLTIGRTINSTVHYMELDRDMSYISDHLGHNTPSQKKLLTETMVQYAGHKKGITSRENESTLNTGMIREWFDISTTTRVPTVIQLFSVCYPKSEMSLISNSPMHIYQYTAPAIPHYEDFVPDVNMVSRYANFIKKYICGGVQKESRDCAFRNVMSILKFALITGEKPMQAIILKGERGSGKSNFCQWISEIFGVENTGVLSMNRLGQQFNTFLTKRLIIFDETNFSSKTADGRQSHTSRERCNSFKELITGLGQLIEPKGKEAYWVQSNALVLACQDSDDTLPESSLHRRIVFTETYKMKTNEKPPDFEKDIKELSIVKNLNNLVAYFCADSAQIALWNRSLERKKQILELPTIAEIRENLGRLSNPYAEQGLGSEVDVRVVEHTVSGKLYIRTGFMFVKDDTFRANQDPGCIFMHTEGLMRMWWLSMTDSGCTPAQIGIYFTEYKEDGTRNPNMFTFDERRHKDLLKWMTMLSIEDENGDFVHTDLGKRVRIKAERLRKWNLHHVADCKGEFFFRFSRDWSQVFGRLLTKPPGQEYPKFIQGDFPITTIKPDNTEALLQISDIPSVSFGGGGVNKPPKVRLRADEIIANEIRAIRAAEPPVVTSFVPSPFF